MKKTLSVILVNLLLLAFFYFLISLLINQGIIEKYCYGTSNINLDVRITEEEYEFLPSDFVRLEVNGDLYYKFCGEDRWDINVNYPGPPIVFLGCSYMYGHGIPLQDTLPYLVSENAHRKAYNYSICGANLILSIDYINSDSSAKENVKNADYAIYLYMFDHINRYLDNPDLYYEYLFNPGMIERQIIKIKLFRVLFSKIRLIKVNREYPKTEYAISLLKSVYKNCISEMRKLMPNAKIIFIVYDEKILLKDNNDIFEKNAIRYMKDVMNSNIWKELSEEEGITVVFTKDIIGNTADKDYKLKADFADWHPNGRAWKEFSPEFVKRYIK